jgi:hypothetical protein
MNDWLKLNPIASGSALIITVLVLFAGFLLLELKRPKRFLALRISALVLMMLSLAAIVFRPATTSIQSQSIGLLTENYDAEKVDSVQKTKSIRLVALPNVKGHRKSEALESINDLEALSGKIVYVAGNGVPESFQDMLSKDNFEFISASYPPGVISLQLPEQIHANRESQVEGYYNSSSSSKIILESNGGREDSVILKAGLNKFNLAFTPKESGNFLYTLISEDEDGVQHAETLPISVKPHQSLRMLCVQNFPTFETQYLKKFLGMENQLQIRYQLSKDTYRHEAINTTNEKVNRLNRENLRNFDLLIIDSDALEKLGSSEISDLRAAINDGLGVLILFNQSPENLRTTKSILPVRFKKYSTDSARINLEKPITVMAWPLTPEMSSSLHPVVKNKNRILSGYVNKGFGKIGFQLLQETYHFVLEGDSTSYSKIWTDVIEGTARREKSSFDISIKTKFPVYQDEPIDLEIISSGDMPMVKHDSIVVSIEEDLYIDNIWRTRIWTDEPGWHFIETGPDSTRTYFYVSKPDAWKTLKAANSIRETTLLSSQNLSDRGQTIILEPVDPLWFYLLFLLSAGSLWLLPKL